MHTANQRGPLRLAPLFLSSMLLMAPLCPRAAGLDDLVNQVTKQQQSEQAQQRAVQDAENAENTKQEQEKLREQGIGVQPYSLQEILRLTPFMMLGEPSRLDPVYRTQSDANLRDMLTLRNVWNMEDPNIQEIVRTRLGSNSLDPGRAVAFGNQNFGDGSLCNGYFNPFSQNSSASQIVTRTLVYLNYSAVKNEQKKMAAAIELKKAMDDLAKQDFRDFKERMRKEAESKSCPSAIKDQLLKNVRKLVDAMLKNEAAIIEDANKILAEANSVVQKAAEAKAKQDQADRLRGNAQHAADLAQLAKQKAELERPYRECHASKGYNLYVLSNAIVNDNSYLLSNQAVISNEKKVAAVSGYENKELMYKAGQRITNLRDEISGLFAKYQQNGGTARSPNDVQLVPVDPCR